MTGNAAQVGDHGRPPVGALVASTTLITLVAVAIGLGLNHLLGSGIEQLGAPSEEERPAPAATSPPAPSKNGPAAASHRSEHPPTIGGSNPGAVELAPSSVPANDPAPTADTGHGPEAGVDDQSPSPRSSWPLGETVEDVPTMDGLVYETCEAALIAVPVLGLGAIELPVIGPAGDTCIHVGDVAQAIPDPSAVEGPEDLDELVLDVCALALIGFPFLGLTGIELPPISAPVADACILLAEEIRGLAPGSAAPSAS